MILIIFSSFLYSDKLHDFRLDTEKNRYFNPEKIDAHTLKYTFGDKSGLEIKDQEQFIMCIPESFQDKVLDYTQIKYRKDKKYSVEKWDKNSAYIYFYIHRKLDDCWFAWKDQFGFRKRAATGSEKRPKKNCFYDISGITGFYPSDMVVLENRGVGDITKAVANIHELKLVFMQNSKDNYNADPDRVFNHPVRKNAPTLSYIINEKTGVELKKWKYWKFIIPEEFIEQKLLFSILVHRKDPSRGNIKSGKRDMHPAYVLFQAHDKETGFYKNWVDSNGDKKYSEIRSAKNPEDETLHNCMKAFGNIKIDHFILKNVGFGDFDKAVANIHRIDLVFRPELKNTFYRTKIYTPDTEFSDASKGKIVPLFGGGPRTDGKFENAVLLGSRRYQRIRKINSLPEKYRFTVNDSSDFDNYLDGLGRLHISLPVGNKLDFIEVAVGDLDITSMSANKDGYYGRSGRSEINLYLNNIITHNREYLIVRGNVGMAGLLAASPRQSEYVIKNGDELIIESNFDVSFLMGYRLTLKD